MTTGGLFTPSTVRGGADMRQCERHRCFQWGRTITMETRVSVCRTICKSLAPRSRQTTTPALVTQFLQTGCSSWRPTKWTNSVKALKAKRRQNEKKTSRNTRVQLLYPYIIIFIIVVVIIIIIIIIALLHPVDKNNNAQYIKSNTSQHALIFPPA